MKVNLIYAHARNGAIGKHGDMPWGRDLPEDLAHFKKTTLNCPVIMGRKTWESLPEAFRPLPGRRNVVLSRDTQWAATGAETYHNLDAAIQACANAAEVWVIGGAQIYAQALPWATKIVATEIDANYEGDAYAPVLGSEWHPAAQDWQIAKSGLRYRFVVWTQ